MDYSTVYTDVSFKLLENKTRGKIIVYRVFRFESITEQLILKQRVNGYQCCVASPFKASAPPFEP